MAKKKTQDEKSLSLEILEKLSTLITTAFGLVAAFAWNDAIKSLFAYLFPQPEGNLTMQFLYALIITVLIVIVTISLAKNIDRLKKVVGK